MKKILDLHISNKDVPSPTQKRHIFYDVCARHTWGTTDRNRDVLAPLNRMARGLQRSACNVPIIGVAMAEVTPDLIEMLELLEYICYLCIE